MVKIADGGIHMSEEELLKIGDVARTLKVARNTVYRWTASGKLPVLQSPTGMLRIRRTDLDVFLQLKASRYKGAE